MSFRMGRRHGHGYMAAAGSRGMPSKKGKRADEDPPEFERSNYPLRVVRHGTEAPSMEGMPGMRRVKPLDPAG